MSLLSNSLMTMLLYITLWIMSCVFEKLLSNSLELIDYLKRICYNMYDNTKNGANKMAIGERIRFIRNLHGATQKWLG